MAGTKLSGYSSGARWVLILPSVLIIALTLLVFSSVLVYQRSYAGRIYRGVDVLGWDVGGMTPAQAAAHLRDKIRYYEDAQLIFRYRNQLWIATPQQLGAEFDAGAAAAEAYAVGRAAGLRENLWRQIDVSRRGYTVIPRAVYDPAQARRYLERLAQEINQPAQNAGVTINGLTAEIIPSQVGRRLDMNATLAAVEQRLVHHSDALIDLSVQEIPPIIDDAAARPAKEQVNRLLSAPVVVRYDDRTWTISRGTLHQWVVVGQSTTGDKLELEAHIDPAKVRSWVEPLAAEVYQLPEDARLDFDPATGQVRVAKMSREGRVLDIDSTVDRILSAVQGGPERTVVLAVIIEPPAVDGHSVSDMGIKELVSQATTYFGGSPAGRVKNIEISASKFDGAVVPPGEVFSFNHYLGDVSEEEGYEEAYIISGDRTAVGIGGGVCQVSTTAFRAAFFGGFPIVERWAHGYRVDWYEINSIPGLDATIYSPLVDFKFRNDTGAYLLIETEVNASAGTVTFYFYGTKPNREVELEGPEITNVTLPKDPVYEVDDELPPGTIKQIDWASEGSDVIVYRIIKRDGEVISREKFESHYQAWSDVYLVSPETAIPDQG